MHRFFTADIHGDVATITGEDVHHLKRVLRLKTGDAVSICNGGGTDYDGSIRSVTDELVTVQVENPRPSPYEPGLTITLYQGLPKGAKLDLIVQKAVELGATSIVPITSARCVAEPTRDFEKKRTRLQRIADEAAKQSRRGLLPSVTGIRDIKQLDFADCDLALIAYEDERGTTLKQVLRGSKATRIAIIIGPEGGLEEQEVASLKARGAIPVSLGKSILRTETAGMAAIGCVCYELAMQG